LWSFVREAVAILLIISVASLIIKTFLVQAFLIPSESMEPTLHGCTGCLDDRVIVNKQFSHMGGLHRGDIVVFRDSQGWLSHPFLASVRDSRAQEALAFIGLAPSSGVGNLVKRVIGVGGDTVEGRDGLVFVNGKKLAEPYVFPGDHPAEQNFLVTVPAGKLWVMGDHRSASSDSRFHLQDPGKGFVPVKDVVGTAFAIVWPLDRIGHLD
jgi:signal peptidase I